MPEERGRGAAFPYLPQDGPLPTGRRAFSAVICTRPPKNAPKPAKKPEKTSSEAAAKRGCGTADTVHALALGPKGVGIHSPCESQSNRLSSTFGRAQSTCLCAECLTLLYVVY